MPATKKAAPKITGPFLEIELGKKVPKKTVIRFNASKEGASVGAIYIDHKGMEELGHPTGVKIYVVPL